MSAYGAHRRYRLHSLVLAIVLFAVLLALALGVSLGADAFNQYTFFRFPFGFYLVGQALLIVIAAAAFWFARVQQHLDEELAESGEF